jgi:hypothetical protein
VFELDIAYLDIGSAGLCQPSSSSITTLKDPLHAAVLQEGDGRSIYSAHRFVPGDARGSPLDPQRDRRRLRETIGQLEPSAPHEADRLLGIVVGEDLTNAEPASASFQHAIVEYAGAPHRSAGTVGEGSLTVSPASSLSMTDSKVRLSSSSGVVVGEGTTLSSFSDNELIDNEGYAVIVAANEVESLGSGIYGPNDERSVLAGGRVTQVARWDDLGVPYVFEDLGILEQSGAGREGLTVTAGVRLELFAHGSLWVLASGRFAPVGTVDNPVTITSHEAVPAPGDWEQVLVQNAGTEAHFPHTIIEYGGGYGATSSSPMVFVQLSAQLSMFQTTLRHSGGGGGRDSKSSTWATPKC